MSRQARSWQLYQRFDRFEMSTQYKFLVYFDDEVFADPINITSYERSKLLFELGGSVPRGKQEIRDLVKVAVKSKEKNPEVWIFETHLTQSEIQQIIDKQPEEFKQEIRKEGKLIYQPSVKYSHKE